MQAKLFEILVNESITGVMVFDPADRRCIYMNRRAREALEFGIGEESTLTKPLFLNDIFPKEARPNIKSLSAELVSADGFFSNVLMRKMNGLAIMANISVKHAVFEDGVSRHLLMFEDITIQKKLQREIESKQGEIEKAFSEILEQNKQLKELDSAKDRFIALTTHELRTPLSAIVATAEVLELKLFESDVQRDDFIKTIHEQGLHLMELVNDILDFAKIRAGKMEFFVENLDLGPLVAKLSQTFEHMATQAAVKLNICVPERPIVAFADALRLKEVVSNVVNNAIKYNRPGGSVTIKIEAKDDGKIARIVVSDTGPGIPPSKIHHVFNEFETVGHVARHHKGTGLGMPISKRLMEAMGGSLTLESTEGVGTTFFIDLPTEKVLSEEFYRSRSDAMDDLAA